MFMDVPAVWVVTVLLLSFATTAVGLRFHLRRHQKRGLGRDDWTALLALLLTWGYAAFVVWGTSMRVVGARGEMSDAIAYADQVKNMGKLYYASNVIMPLTFGTIKLSVLFLYQRIFVGRTFKRYTLGVSLLISGWIISFFITFIFLCKLHPEALWKGDPELIWNNCIADGDACLAFAVIDVVLDIAILVIPVPMIRHLQLSNAVKAGLYFIFGLGTFSTIAATIRMSQVVLNSYLMKSGVDDIIAMTTIDLMWGFIEASTGVTAACLPTLGHFLRRLPALRSIFESLRSKFLSSPEESSVPTIQQTYETDIEYARRDTYFEKPLPALPELTLQIPRKGLAMTPVLARSFNGEKPRR